MQKLLVRYLCLFLCVFVSHTIGVGSPDIAKTDVQKLRMCVTFCVCHSFGLDVQAFDPFCVTICALCQVADLLGGPRLPAYPEVLLFCVVLVIKPDEVLGAYTTLKHIVL